MVKGRVVKRIVKEIPEDLEARIGGFLATFNSELKDATVLCLGQSPRNGPEIRDEFKRRIGYSITAPTDAWIPKYTTFAALCHHTLVPIGFVAEEYVKKANTGR